MKISEIRGEAALDVLAELLEPGSILFADPKIAEALRCGKPLDAARVALHDHKKEVIAVLAALDGVAPEEYDGGVFSPIVKVVELFNEPELVSLFTSESQIERQSGSRSVNTEE